ncbi:uncharacterized protein LOC130168019 [Seriola aureovittata]|uniref:uncharacterized protein LOC130168019 n=1 Tax=Seriola aureovittata TaxID=2871759 RepID=UPI0024BEC2B5|nr:uncharacterized protein LOC130168019 [Seriola aureovittata]
MGLSGLQIRTWKLFVCLSWMCVVGTMAKPQYMVAVPAVLEAGAETTFCASLLQPNETLVMTVTLISQEKNTSLLKRTSSEESHTSYQIDQNSPCYKETKQLVSTISQHGVSEKEVGIRNYPNHTYLAGETP